MATIDAADAAGVQQQQAARAKASPEGYPAGGVRFDLLATVMTGWFIFGMFIDGWAHNHGRVDNTFFTPWHAILYSGVLANAAFLTFNQYRNMAKGYPWLRALPRGYLLSLIGVAGFFVAGGFDFLWHSWFGFEADIEALLSPAHLALASGAFLFVTGPLRAAWLRARAEEKAGWIGMLPVVISLLALLSLLTFFTQYTHAFSNARFLSAPRSSLPSNTDFEDASTIAAVLIQSAEIMGVICLAMRRWKLPIGSLTLLIGANMALMYWMRYNTSAAHTYALIVGLGAAVFADVLFALLKPSAERPIPLRIFAFVVPFAMFGALFVVLVSTVGVWWSVHMWLGVTFLAGIVGLFVSYLAVPPAVPAQ